MKVKRDKVDDVFSKVIREAADWTCDCCGKVIPEDRRMALHASHYMSRRHAATRFDPDNVYAHCFSCHQKLGENPSEFYRWMVDRVGEEEEERIRSKALSVFKRSKVDKELLYKHFKSELARIIEARKNGAAGKLKVEGFGE